MKFCQDCKKTVSALGLNVTFCIALKHDIVDKTFGDMYREAMKFDG